MNSLLEVAEKQLDRTHAFFPRNDGKLASLLALLSGQVAVLFLNIRPDDLNYRFVAVSVTAFALAAAAAGAHLFKCAALHTRGGGGRSLYYFSTIAQRTEHDYIRQFRAESDEARLDDALSQVHRNSEIVAKKFNSLKWATILIVLAAVPWATALLSISLLHHTVPRVISS